MTRKELSQLYNLKKEIAEDTERLHRMEAAARSVSPSSGSSRACGSVTDRTAIAASIADLRASITLKIKRETEECQRLMDYIETIDDAMTRRIFKARFVDCLSWVGVANRIGGGNTPEMARQRCYRFLREEK